MARQINRLSALSVKRLLRGKPVGRHADGNGLYLNISSNGGARWVFLYRQHGKLKEKGLGGATTVALADARTKATDMRKLAQCRPRSDQRGPQGRRRDDLCAVRSGIHGCEPSWLEKPQAPPAMGEYNQDLRRSCYRIAASCLHRCRPSYENHRSDLDGKDRNGLSGSRPDRNRSRLGGCAWISQFGKSCAVARASRQAPAGAAEGRGGQAPRRPALR